MQSTSHISCPLYLAQKVLQDITKMAKYKNKMKARRKKYVRKKKNFFHLFTIPKLVRRLHPRLYKNDVINQQQASELCENKVNRGHRQQVNGLIYDVSQMPNASSDNSWPIVFRAPTRDSSPKFAKFNLGEGKGSILIHHPNVIVQPDSNIHAATVFALQNHSHNRVIEGEGGVMVGAGRRYEPVSATVVPYVNKNFTGVHQNDVDGQQLFVSSTYSNYTIREVLSSRYPRFKKIR